MSETAVLLEPEIAEFENLSVRGIDKRAVRAIKAMQKLSSKMEKALEKGVYSGSVESMQVEFKKIQLMAAGKWGAKSTFKNLFSNVKRTINPASQPKISSLDELLSCIESVRTTQDQMVDALKKLFLVNKTFKEYQVYELLRKK